MDKKEILISTIGNTIEWFDLGIFIFMVPIIGPKFFPQDAAISSTIEALIVFAIGFLCRPVGGILFGYLGDTQGRAKTLRISILMITLSTLSIGLIPSYEEIGVSASIIFILLRLLQGLSIGGEYSGTMIYLAESASPKNRGFITSFAASGANLGFLFATVIFMMMNCLWTAETLNEWAWRIPFLIIGLPGSLIIFYRFQLPETAVYSALKSMHQLEQVPLLTAMKFAPLQLIKILGLTCMSASFYYFFVLYITTYVEHYLGFSKDLALIFQSAVLVIMLFAIPVGAIFGDYYSRKKMMIITTSIMLLFIFPCYYLFQSQSLLLTALGVGIATMISSFDQGNTLTAIVENCPENVRYSGIAFAYNLGNALFGSTIPLFATLLIEYISPIAPYYYLFFMTLIGLTTIMTLLSKNQSMSSILSPDTLNSQDAPPSYAPQPD